MQQNPTKETKRETKQYEKPLTGGRDRTSIRKNSNMAQMLEWSDWELAVMAIHMLRALMGKWTPCENTWVMEAERWKLGKCWNSKTLMKMKNGFHGLV